MDERPCTNGLNSKELFQKALEHYRSGEQLEAERLSEEICEGDPNYAPAWYLLGMIAYRKGEYDAAIERMGRAVALSPQTAFFHDDLGKVFFDRGDVNESIACYRNVLILNPGAVRTYCRLAVALKKKGLLDEALKSLVIALKLKPDEPDALYQAGFIFSEKGMPNEAIACFKKLIQMEPNRENVLFALGVAYGEVDRNRKAMDCYRKVLGITPGHARAWNNLGFLLKEQGLIAEAIEAYQEAIQIHPDLSGAHWNVSHALLLQGELERGWREFEWRLKKEDWKKANLRRCTVPLWDGQDFAGKTLFVHDEQGLGDTIQFIRYLPMVKERGGDVIFETQEALMGLLTDFPGIDRLMVQSKDGILPGDIDFYVPLLSLPAIFNTSLDTIPNTVPYLFADPEKSQYWRDRLPQNTFNVGIVWAGAPKNPNDRNRSCPLRFFEPLSNIRGVRMIGIQKGTGAEQVKELPLGMELVNYGPELNDFTDTMGLIENLDLVIAVDTAVAHLAGAMGKPVWLILTYAHHWTWLLEKKDSPWYPSMRIYRQEKRGDWAFLMKQVAQDIKAEMPKRGPSEDEKGNFIPFNKVGTCRHGLVCYNQNDMYIGKSFELYGEFSEGEIALFKLVATEGGIVLDIGANIGAHTLFLSKAVGPRGQVHAFEPQRIVFQTLCANMALNHITNAYCYNAALGKEPGTIRVPQVRPCEHFNFGGLSLGRHQSGEVVEVKTIDSLGLAACTFIKIDVEGMELDVLMGGEMTINKFQPILYVENDRKERSAALINYIDSLGYHMYWHKPPLYNPDNFLKNPTNVFDDIISLNMICLPKKLGELPGATEKVRAPFAEDRLP